MKRIIVVILVLILLLILLWWWSRTGADEATFSGTLRDSSGQPVAGALIRVGDNTTKSDAQGRFVVKGAWVRSERWVLEVRHPGFAPISKVFGQGVEGLDLTTVKTTVRTFDAASAIVARDMRSNCIGSITATANWGAHPVARFPRTFDTAGNQVTGKLPPEAQRVLAFSSAAQPCGSGFQVSVPASSLVNTSGQVVQGQVQLGLSTVDLYSPDGMPGDYTVAGEEGPAYMESFGAGTLEARAGDQILQLRKGSKASIEIPVDPAQIKAGAKIPPTIPLLRYEPASGDWHRIGEATLDTGRMVYVGEVTHFSEFNADVIKTDPACLRFDASGIAGSFELAITAPTASGGYRQVTRTVAPNPGQTNPNLHAIFNLPANAWVALRAIRSGMPIGTWLVETGGPWGGTAAPTYDYAACGTVFNLSETMASGVTHDGSTHQFGPLPKHVSFLVNTAGATEDVYPVGGTNCSAPCLYVFSLFDTGSPLVVIDNTTTSLLGISLTPNPLWDVDVRINGLGALNAGLAAPYGTPGAAGGAQAHSGVIRVAPRGDTITEEETRTDASGTPVGGFVSVNYNLIGAPVANKVVARIDYTNPVTKGPWTFAAAPFTITAPDIQFFQPGDPAIPTPALTLFVEGFGTVSDATTGSLDQRRFLQNVTFTEGSHNVYDDQTTSSPVRFLYDSATTYTVISQAMATALGVSPASPNPAAGCSSLDTSNFVTLDAITVVGMNSSHQLATYRINNAEVCVDVAGTVITTNYPDPANPGGPPRIVDAIIGANLFDQAKVLWDGPRSTLGILP